MVFMFYIGTLFLFVCFIRMINIHFTQNHHIGYECAIWYWHFVDVVWIFVYFSLYVSASF
jgi:cytochrome c oxidase subunit 3